MCFKVELWTWSRNWLYDNIRLCIKYVLLLDRNSYSKVWNVWLILLFPLNNETIQEKDNNIDLTLVNYMYINNWWIITHFTFPVLFLGWKSESGGVRTTEQTVDGDKRQLWWSTQTVVIFMYHSPSSCSKHIFVDYIGWFTVLLTSQYVYQVFFLCCLESLVCHISVPGHYKVIHTLGIVSTQRPGLLSLGRVDLVQVYRDELLVAKVSMRQPIIVLEYGLVSWRYPYW